ncbi:hypothetical protein ACFV6E_22485 [Streptomyces sp. NPDC059785]|uniref:hypothetical protein n=1 Tax=unclassified Streptomyces TaxID=2593676 RepID=UPI0036609D93
MHVRIITAAQPSGWLLYEEESRPERPAATVPAPWLGLAGVDDDPAEFHIVRGID